MRFSFRNLFTTLKRLSNGGIRLSNRSYESSVAQIRQQSLPLAELTEDELRQRATSIRDRVREGVSVTGILIEAYAVICEVARRTVGLAPFDVQLLAGVALHDRKLVEMQTGEGKTLAAIFPAILTACLGRGVHLLTFNDYLAERDAQWMGPAYHYFGLTVGHVVQGMETSARKQAYGCDVTYVTAKEAGFDFLRDQICLDPQKMVHRGFHCAIVDEADSILIDEARVPLVIAAAEPEQVQDLYRLANMVRQLRPGRDYATDQRSRNVSFQTSALNRLQNELGCGDLYDERNIDLLTRLNLALQAEVLLHRDKDYLVRNDGIALIDELTGRIAQNRRWPYGLQAAIEAKEGVPIQPQGRILNSITLQHFLEQYDHRSGMTGTAQAAADELFEFYKMKVVVVPTNRASIRQDLPDKIFPRRHAKFLGLVSRIVPLHREGTPILLGTSSVEESEILAEMLSHSGVTCQVLNARNDWDEARMIAEAGAWGAVTISTNMAGRGTDIRLGGSDQRDRERVIAAGGLHVFGLNRHESRRIDDQLRGRAGRQGDPGQTQFFVSLEDDLMARYGLGELIPPSHNPHSTSGDVDPSAGEMIEHVQRVIEGECFEIRRTLRRYSFCLEQQRRTIQQRRSQLLLRSVTPRLLQNVDPECFERMANDVGEDVVREAERQITLWQIDQCWSEHLAHAAQLRDQIHLISMGGFNPLDEFHRELTRGFRDVTTRIDRNVISKLKSIRLTPQGIDLAEEGLLGPSSTWTYMINDNLMGDMLQRINRNLKRLLTGTQGPPASRGKA
ncbi:accessory Sec system translocase SecA2 [Schlesneria sp. DSM 10557]|uniref:accessory Sec system translocase SecA2 n=1 Tax=Schlesneria sp. DSM 10557 TaxID=3044399 RepID=UPI00359FDE89